RALPIGVARLLEELDPTHAKPIVLHLMAREDVSTNILASAEQALQESPYHGWVREFQLRRQESFPDILAGWEAGAHRWSESDRVFLDCVIRATQCEPSSEL